MFSIDINHKEKLIMASVKYRRKKLNTTQEKLPRHKRQDRAKKRIMLTFKLEYTSRTNLFLGVLLIFGHCASDLTLHHKEKYRVYIFTFCYHKQEFSCNLINIKNSISSLTHDKLEIITEYLCVSYFNFIRLASG